MSSFSFLFFLFSFFLCLISPAILKPQLYLTERGDTKAWSSLRCGCPCVCNIVLSFYIGSFFEGFQQTCLSPRQFIQYIHATSCINAMKMIIVYDIFYIKFEKENPSITHLRGFLGRLVTGLFVTYTKR